MVLDREWETFQANLPALLEKDAGRYVLIHGDQIAGVWDTQDEALRTLYREYASSGDTANLYRVLTRLAAADPDDLVIRNNLAQVALLLNADVPSATKAAADLHQQDPTNAGYATTYAFALFKALFQSGPGASRGLAFVNWFAGFRLWRRHHREGQHGRSGAHGPLSRANGNTTRTNWCRSGTRTGITRGNALTCARGRASRRRGANRRSGTRGDARR